MRPMTDWHPPVLALLWRILIHTTGAISAMAALQSAVLWASFWVLARLVWKKTGSRGLSLVMLAVGLTPHVLTFTGVVWKDVHMAYALLAALAVALSARELPPGPGRVPLGAAGARRAVPRLCRPGPQERSARRGPRLRPAGPRGVALARPAPLARRHGPARPDHRRRRRRRVAGHRTGGDTAVRADPAGRSHARSQPGADPRGGRAGGREQSTSATGSSPRPSPASGGRSRPTCTSTAIRGTARSASRNWAATPTCWCGCGRGRCPGTGGATSPTAAGSSPSCSSRAIWRSTTVRRPSSTPCGARRSTSR